MASVTSEHEHPHEETETEVGENREPAESAEEPATPPPPAHVPPAGDGERIDRIENVVNGLVDIVSALAPRDERPTKLPWTHRLGGADR